MTDRISIETMITLSDEDIIDLMSCADTSIAYWVDEAAFLDKELGKDKSIEEYVAAGGELRLWVYEPWETDADGNDVVFYDLNRSKLIDGIYNWFVNGYDRYDAVDLKAGTIDMANVDGEMADIIVQYALFNDIIYG